MKQVIFGIINVFLLVLFMVILLVVSENGLRHMELRMNLGNAMTTTMSNAIRRYGLEDYDKNDWTAEFMENLLIQASDNDDICVSINEMDMEKGIMAVTVKEEFVYANGRRSSRTENRTMIIDRPEEKEEKTYNVTFICDLNQDGQVTSIPFAKYTLDEEESWIDHEFPAMEGYKFMKKKRINTFSKDVEIHGIYEKL